MVTRIVWDVISDNVLMESDQDVIIASYTYEPSSFGPSVSQRRNSITSYAHFDGEHSTRQLTDDTETVTESATFSVFGETVASTGMTEMPFLYKGALGYYTDALSNDVYARARYYQPLCGRWMSVDPRGNADGPNLYLFVDNNPEYYVDPSGWEKHVFVFEGLGGYSVRPRERTPFWRSDDVARKEWKPIVDASGAKWHYYAQDDVEDAVDDIIAIATKNHGTDCDPIYDTIIIAGFSFGGGATVEAMGKLEARDIQVNYVQTADPVARLPNPAAELPGFAGEAIEKIRIINLLGFPLAVPDNFDAWQNFYQRAGIIRGSKLKNDRVENTKYRGSELTDTAHYRKPLRFGLVDWGSLWIGAHLVVPGQEKTLDALKTGIEGVPETRRSYRTGDD